ncbi:MAG: cytochrome c [Syntrophaceae bacterium]|nr:cytochrome c [Syntrophaceae bacterium]
MKRWLWVITTGYLLLFSFSFVSGQPPKPPSKTPELLGLGKKLYDQNCASCHGPKGDGKTPLGSALIPPPRDFNIPLDQWPHSKGDLKKVFDAISKGIPKTAMVKWDQLSERERWGMTYYVMEFAKPKTPKKK